MCGWNIHSSHGERQNFSTLLVAFKLEMNLLSPGTICSPLASQHPEYQENLFFFFLLPWFNEGGNGVERGKLRRLSPKRLLVSLYLAGIKDNDQSWQEIKNCQNEWMWALQKKAGNGSSTDIQPATLQIHFKHAFVPNQSTLTLKLHSLTNWN